MKEHSEKFQQAKRTLLYFGRVLKLFSRSGKWFILLTILSAIVASISPSISVLIMQEIINTIQLSSADVSYLIKLLIIYVGIDFFSGAVAFCCSYYESIFQMKTSLDINLSILKKVNEFTLQDFENAEIYNLLQRAMNVGPARIFSFFKSFILAGQYLISAILFGAILFCWKWWLVPVVLIIPIINTLCIAYFGKKQFMIRKQRSEKERKQYYFRYLLTNDIAFKEIKTFDLWHYLWNGYKKLGLEFLHQDKTLLNERTKSQTLLFILDQLVNTAVFVYIIFQTFLSKVLIGNLVTYTRSISTVKSSVQVFLTHLNSIYENVLYIGQYFEFIDREKTPEPFQLASHNSSCLASEKIPYIKIDNLSYQYKNQSQKALNGIDLTIEGDSLVALIGKNGSGKTTLVKILSALYSDYEGEIYWGNQNIKMVDPQELRKKIGILFQDFVRYQLTVRENVALGQLEKLNSSEELFHILGKMDLHDKISDLESQLGSWFEGGVQLSGGEWLKVALSRAFIRDADLYLLDEPNAALDSVSEKIVLQSFKELTEGKIGIIVSHRISSIKNIVDKIIVFNHGTIEAIGNHDEAPPHLYNISGVILQRNR